MKRRRKRKREKRTKKNKQGRENYKETTGTKLITNTKKQKLKIQSRVWNFKNTMLIKGRRKLKRKQTNKNKQCRKNYKETTGTKLISNTKKHKLEIQSRVWNFKNTMLKEEKKNKTKKQGQKIILYIYIYMKFAEEEKNRVFFLQSNRL